MTPVNFPVIYDRLDDILNRDGEILYSQIIREQVVTLIKQAEAMAQTYHVVVTNPPYMGASNMGSKLSSYVKKNYPNSKSDMFAVLIEKGNRMTKPNCLNCMVCHKLDVSQKFCQNA